MGASRVSTVLLIGTRGRALYLSPATDLRNGSQSLHPADRGRTFNLWGQLGLQERRGIGELSPTPSGEGARTTEGARYARDPDQRRGRECAQVHRRNGRAGAGRENGGTGSSEKVVGNSMHPRTAFLGTSVGRGETCPTTNLS